MGDVKVNSVSPGELLNDRRIGGIFSVPVSKSRSLRLQIHTGLFANHGLNYDSLMLAYQDVFF